MSETVTSDAPWTIARLLAWTRSHFESKSVDEPRLAAELLLARAIDCRKIDLYTRFDQVPTSEQLARFRESVKAAARHEPIAYLIGRKEFYALEFEVTPDVLIPRPETELVVERALAWMNDRRGEGERGREGDSESGGNAQRQGAGVDVLDVGTGSGCIAVTVAKRCPGARVVATDVSASALGVARGNAQRHGVTGQVAFVEADMLDLPGESVPSGGFDLILSNPPYVAERDQERLAENVRKYEPGLALFGGADGLDAFRRISSGAGRLLRAGGAVILEVGYEQAAAVTRLVEAEGVLVLHSIHRDGAGIERVLQFGRRP